MRLRVQTGKMANEILKQIFRDMQPRIVAGVNPDSVMNVLCSKNVIGWDDCCELGEGVAVSGDRCREMMSRVRDSSHPQAFIHLRLALLDQYSWIVDEIDKQLPSLAAQMHQLHRTYSIDGTKLLPSFRVHTLPHTYILI